jgi:site-specific DNA-cytosine methylase
LSCACYAGVAVIHSSHKVDVLNAKDYYLPQDRDRAWGVCVRTEFHDSMDDARSQGELILQKVHMMADPKGIYSIKSCISSSRLPAPKAKATNTDDSKNQTVEAASDNAWKKLQTTFCLDNGILLSSLKLPSDIDSSPWAQRLPLREKSALAIHLQMKPSLVSVDLNPSLPRQSPCLSEETINTVMPGAKIVLPGLNRQLSGIDCMMFQGFSEQLCSKAPRTIIIVIYYIL